MHSQTSIKDAHMTLTQFFGENYLIYFGLYYHYTLKLKPKILQMKFEILTKYRQETKIERKTKQSHFTTNLPRFIPIESVQNVFFLYIRQVGLISPLTAKVDNWLSRKPVMSSEYLNRT